MALPLKRLSLLALILLLPSFHSTPAAIIFNPVQINMAPVRAPEPDGPEMEHADFQSAPAFALGLHNGHLIALNHEGKEDLIAQWDGFPPTIDDQRCMRFDTAGMAYEKDWSEHTEMRYDTNGFLTITTNRSDRLGRCQIQITQTSTKTTISFSYHYFETDQIIAPREDYKVKYVFANFDALLSDLKLREWFDVEILLCFPQGDLQRERFNNARIIASVFHTLHLPTVSATAIATYVQLVHQLDDDDYEVRSTAMQKLKEAGVPAGLYLIDLNRDSLSPEQKCDVDCVLNSIGG